MTTTVRYGECELCGRGPTTLIGIPAEPDEGVSFWDVCTACWDYYIDKQLSTLRSTL